MAPISRLAEARGLVAVYSSKLACWAIFGIAPLVLVGTIRDVDLDTAPNAEAFVHLKLSRWADEMGSLCALADEAARPKLPAAGNGHSIARDGYSNDFR